MSWSTDFSKLPKEGRVIVQCRSGGIYHFRVSIIEEGALVRGHELAAWHPEPEPYKPPKPEQISLEEADKYKWAQIVEEASPRMRLGKTPMQKLVAAVEKRTREIVEWESKYE